MAPSAINQVDERDTDRLMNRTRTRPVADGRIGAGEGRVIALVLSAVAAAPVRVGANTGAALVALATLVTTRSSTRP